jgi:signal-transduction protein with cAMP-binding, CBS, and nucleotidyltransferase domain
MTTGMRSVTLDANLEECMQLITDKRIRHLPVMENDSVVGVVSIGDIVKGIIEHKEYIIDQLERYIKGHR